MSATPLQTCVQCGRDENMVPLVPWRYQGQAFALCADCLPQMIHKRAGIMQKLPGEPLTPTASGSNDFDLRAA